MGQFRTNALVFKGALAITIMAATSLGCGGAAQPAAEPSTTGSRVMRPDAARTSEQQRAVEAFAGQWVYHSKITLPDGKSVQADITMSCAPSPTAKYDVCTFGGNIPGVGSMDARVLVGTDRSDNRVHFMAMTSDDELHDHVCSWK